jgi:signal transduction histidine kinase
MITAFAIGSIIKFQRSLYDRLYKQAAINNDDLLEKTLQAKKAEKQAQTATEAKSNFLANMSHEIRTPINTIMGMDEMILRETSEKVVEEYALDIKTASQNLLSLINDILDITKIESGKMGIVKGEYGKTPVPIDPEFQKMILKGEEPITCRPADLIEPELDKLRKECAEWTEQEEDVLTYAMFPKVAPKFFEARRNKKYGVDGKNADAAAKVHTV